MSNYWKTSGSYQANICAQGSATSLFTDACSKKQRNKKSGKFLLLKSETIYWRFDTYTTYNQTPTRNKH